MWVDNNNHYKSLYNGGSEAMSWLEPSLGNILMTTLPAGSLDRAGDGGEAGEETRGPESLPGANPRTGVASFDVALQSRPGTERPGEKCNLYSIISHSAPR